MAPTICQVVQTSYIHLVRTGSGRQPVPLVEPNDAQKPPKARQGLIIYFVYTLLTICTTLRQKAPKNHPCTSHLGGLGGTCFQNICFPRKTLRLLKRRCCFLSARLSKHQNDPNAPVPPTREAIRRVPRCRCTSTNNRVLGLIKAPLPPPYTGGD